MVAKDGFVLRSNGRDKEVDACAFQRGISATGVGDEMRGVRVGEEAGNNAGFSDDLVVELDCWYETSLEEC